MATLIFFSFFIGIAKAEAPLSVIEEPVQVIEVEPSEEIVQVVEARVPDVMLRVAYCESGNRQFHDDGTLVRGVVNPKDVGRFQINEYYHLETSQKLGIDIYTWEGNTQYAMWLYENQGLTPWNWSKHCWSLPQIPSNAVDDDGGEKGDEEDQ